MEKSNEEKLNELKNMRSRNRLDIPKRFIDKKSIENFLHVQEYKIVEYNTDFRLKVESFNPDIEEILINVVDDDIELWNKIIDKYPESIEFIPKKYITDDMLLKAYDKSKKLINTLLEIKPEIVTEDMIKNCKCWIDSKNKDIVRKIIKDDSVYKILVENNPFNILLLPKNLITNDMCYKAILEKSILIKLLPEDYIHDSIYIDLVMNDGYEFIAGFPKDNKRIFTTDVCLKVLRDNYSFFINYIPTEYITDDICKSFSPFCNYIISNKDKIDIESACIDFVNKHCCTDNDDCNSKKEIFLLGKKYAGKAIDILIERDPYLLGYARMDDRNSYDIDFYTKLLKKNPKLLCGNSIPETKRTTEMYINTYNHANCHDCFGWCFPYGRKDLINDDLCIEYLKSHLLNEIPEEYRTEKVCLYAYEQDPYNIKYFPKNRPDLFKEEMVINYLSNHIEPRIRKKDCDIYYFDIEKIPEECITAKIVEKAFEVAPYYILNDKCSKFITKEMCIKLANDNNLRFIYYIDDDMLLELYDVIIDKINYNI